MRSFLTAGVLLLGSGLLAFSQGPPPPPREPPLVRRDYPDRPRVDEWAFKADARRELGRLSGVWGLVSVEQNGRVIAGTNDDDQLVIRGERYFRTTNGEPAGSGVIRFVDLTGRLRHMLFISADGETQGMRFPTTYWLEGNRLSYIQGPGDSRDFPRRLETRAGDGFTMARWRRLDW